MSLQACKWDWRICISYFFLSLFNIAGIEHIARQYSSKLHHQPKFVGNHRKLIIKIKFPFPEAQLSLILQKEKLIYSFRGSEVSKFSLSL